MKISLVGAGNMGLAFLRRWCSANSVTPENCTVVEVSPERCELVKKELGINAGADWDLLRSSQIIFLAVKPQEFSKISQAILPQINSESHIVSIMAGVTTDNIQKALKGHARIIRAMPNLPVIVGQGMTAFYSRKEVGEEIVARIENLFSICGKVVRLTNEDLLDAVTAISGSGPGYVYYFIEAVEDLCGEFGFTNEQAYLLATQTIEGALAVMHSENMSAIKLREMVTSKGGTTEAAISHFDKASLLEAFKGGLRIAKDRAKQLSQG